MTSNEWGGDGMAPFGHMPPRYRSSGLTDEEKRLILMEAYNAAPKRILREAANLLQTKIGRGNAERGFHDEGDDLRSYDEGPVNEIHTAALRNYYMVKVGLIMSEGAEALEELRSGRHVSQNYYTINGREVFPATDGQGADWTTRSDGLTNDRDLELTETWTGVLPKPEGVPSEIADIVIRCFDFADEAGFSLITAILEKLAYNDTRSRMHGRQV